MDLLVFYSGNDNQKIKTYLNIFTELDINVELWQMNSNWQSDKNFLKKLTNHNHYLMTVSRDSLKSSWIDFIIGYCFGKDNIHF